MRCYLLLISSFFVACSVHATADNTKNDLKQVQKQLIDTNKTFKQQRKQFNQLENDIKRADTQIAQSSKKLKKLKFDIELSYTEQATLKEQINQLEQDKSNQQTALSAQLKSAYTTGSHDYTKLLLNQDKVKNVERTLNYYQYLNNARIKELEQLKATLAQLEQSQLLLEKNQLQLTSLLNVRQQQQDKLIAAKQQQKTKHHSLKVALEKTQSQLEYLKQNEQVLKDTLQQLAREVEQSDIQLIGLKTQRGTLNWPIRGKLTRRFGQQKHGGLRWKGVLMSEKEGTPVKTIADGQVLYADWLKGFGWVIVVDHGKGFMSLYGHSQALLKNVGDKVQAGEQIALIGQSGGQTDPGLYFEIRHKGRPVNPVKWCRQI